LKVTRVGLDTGFLLKFYYQNSEVLKYWENFLSGKWEGVVNLLSFFEFAKTLIKRGESFDRAKEFWEWCKKAFYLTGVTEEVCEKASRISITFDLPAIDALIYVSFLLEGCEKIITTNTDFQKVKGIDVIVI